MEDDRKHRQHGRLRALLRQTEVPNSHLQTKTEYPEPLEQLTVLNVLPEDLEQRGFQALDSPSASMLYLVIIVRFDSTSFEFPGTKNRFSDYSYAGGIVKVFFD
jgi:hypothetical protein